MVPAGTSPLPGSRNKNCHGEDVAELIPVLVEDLAVVVVLGPDVSEQVSGNGQETAAFTSSTIFFSTTALHFWSAYDTGHRSPSSRLAASWKPRVEYR